MRCASVVALGVAGVQGACLDPESPYGECCGKGPNEGKPSGNLPWNAMDLGCFTTKCGLHAAQCMLDSQCRKMLSCELGCIVCNRAPFLCETPLIDEQVPSCDFFCGMYFGANNTASKKFSSCLQDHKCLHGKDKLTKPYPECGKCHIVPELDGVKNLTSMSQIAGDWWVVGGLNYVYDSYPCDMCRWHKWEDEPWNPGHETGYVNRVTWNNSVPYTPIKRHCKASSGDCGKGLVQVEAMPTAEIIVPGVLHHNYTTPLTSFVQLENWTVMAWPHPDWLFVQWCGENFALDYAGAIILTKYPNVDQSTMPGYVRDAFRASAKGIDFDKDMFEVKNGDCPYEGGPKGKRSPIV